jgi:hypothetical protein
MSHAEWAAGLTVADLDLLINRCVQERDFKGLSAALHLMAVKDPSRAEHWRDTLLLAVDLGRAAREPSQTSANVDAVPADRAASTAPSGGVS